MLLKYEVIQISGTKLAEPGHVIQPVHYTLTHSLSSISYTFEELNYLPWLPSTGCEYNVNSKNAKNADAMQMDRNFPQKEKESYQSTTGLPRRMKPIMGILKKPKIPTQALSVDSCWRSTGGDQKMADALKETFCGLIFPSK